MREEKAALRHDILARRDKMDQEERRAGSSAILALLVGQPEYSAAAAILFYVNFRGEVATRGMIAEALGSGKKVLVPKVDRKAHRLKLFEIRDMSEDLEAGYMGIYEPVEGHARPAAPEEVDMVVLPGVGFDKSGRRLGYGGGYYDRLIEMLRPGVPLLALAFDRQVVDEVPAEAHDKRVDKVITETRVITA